MGYSNVLLTISAIAISAVLIVSMKTSSNAADNELASYQHQLEARESSQSAFELVKRQLYKTANWADIDSLSIDTTSFRSSEFSVESPSYSISVPGDKEDLVFTITGKNGPAEHKIVANYSKKRIPVTELPAALNYTLLADKDINIRDRSGTYGDSLSTNSNVHSNGDMTLDGDLTYMEVEGFGTHSGSFSGSNAYLDPNDTNGGSPVNFQAPQIDIPTLDIDAIRSVATAITTGNVDILGSGEVDMSNFMGVTGYGTEQNPFIWLIEGDVYINAWVKFIGHSIIVSSGTIEIHDCGKVSCTTSFPPESGVALETRNWTQTNLPNGNQLAMYAKDSFIMSDYAVAVAQIYAENDISFSGAQQNYANVIGSVISKGDVEITNKFQTWYWPMSMNLISPPWETEIELVELTDFSEWSSR